MNSITQIKRGDIYYVTGVGAPEPTGAEIWPDRAAVVVSADIFNKTSHAVEVVYLSTSEHKKPCPTHIPVMSGTKKALALCEQIHTVDISRLQDKFGHITDDELKDISGGILFGLGINRGHNPQGIFKKYERQLANAH